jgi:hypothetical protein
MITLVWRYLNTSKFEKSKDFQVLPTVPTVERVSAPLTPLRQRRREKDLREEKVPFILQDSTMAKLLLMRRSVPFITLLLLISLTVGTSPVLASSLTVQTNELAATKTSSLSSTLTTTSSRTSSSSSESSSRQKRRKRSTTESVERRLNTVFFHHKHKKYLQRGRKLEEYYEETYDDDIYQADTDDDSAYSQADELCSEFLVSFLEGTTDAHDTCEGIMNAYTAAGTYKQCRLSVSLLLIISHSHTPHTHAHLYTITIIQHSLLRSRPDRL